MSRQPNLDAVAAQLCQQNGFEFRGLLGRGAFKSVYLAVNNGTQFALKIATSVGGADRFIREVVALKDCSHPSIAKLYHSFAYDHGGHQFLVVYEEYLAGGTFEAGLKQWQITPDAVRTVGLGLAAALDHMHDRRLVHRDIKPANIMFRGGEATRPVLTDFGIVRMLDQPTLTHAFMQMGPGTPAYAAPEQLNNDKALIDWRTDQFGLSIVLGECLLGHHPWLVAGKSIQDAIFAVAARQEMPAVNAQRLHQLRFSSLTQSLRVWPVARYRKPSEFIDALQRN